ncbi:rod shape-determining protein MreC [Helicobacter mesocricetorum]|uniref:rod shape-determining protein MreC n=1 Tax=Helicobacter mesocricetorum TaxID=87012 RepID=UPI000CF0F1EB|nr:rod shape-determining protein MreC [Helicobacter mesocricetorum]
MKKVFLWIVFIATILFVSTKVSKEIHSEVLYLGNAIKIGILNINNNIINIITRHFRQAEQIKHLNNELRDKQQIEYFFNALNVEHKQLLESVSSKLSLELPNIHLVRNISYVDMNNYVKIWLQSDFDRRPDDKLIFGLIHNNSVAGIAKFENHRLIGYLNGDEKCSYSTVIGENKIPGIAKYDANKGFIVDYIPLFPPVQIGDIVYTSGYDNIFYPEILVGEVQSVEYRHGYQIAVVKPALDKVVRFYWLIDIKNDGIEIENER